MQYETDSHDKEKWWHYGYLLLHPLTKTGFHAEDSFVMSNDDWGEEVEIVVEKKWDDIYAFQALFLIFLRFITGNRWPELDATDESLRKVIAMYERHGVDASEFIAALKDG